MKGIKESRTEEALATRHCRRATTPVGAARSACKGLPALPTCRFFGASRRVGVLPISACVLRLLSRELQQSTCTRWPRWTGQQGG
jgi:hypothetical protein